MLMLMLMLAHGWYVDMDSDVASTLPSHSHTDIGLHTVRLETLTDRPDPN